MPVNSELAQPRSNSVPADEPPGRRVRIVTISLMAAALALALSASWFGDPTGAATVARESAPRYSTTRPNVPASSSFNRGRVPSFFGFLEFDWDPDAPEGVPGFDPWPSSQQHP
jgi:hypothetical protein